MAQQSASEEVIAAPTVTGRRRPGLRLAMMVLAGGLVLGQAALVSANAASHVEEAALDQATTQVEAVVHGYIDPLLPAAGFASLDAASREAVTTELTRLTASGKILRIKVWDKAGTVVFSDLPALRGRSFGPPAPDLAEVLAGATSAEITDGSDPENIFEHGLAPRLLSIYLPIVPTGASTPIGAYEVYEDGAPIETAVSDTRSEVLLASAALAAALLGLLWIGFTATSRRLAQQNGRLRDQATRQEALSNDLRHQALHDVLTGLANRSLFTDRLQHALARAQRSGLRPAILFIDLDDFKTVNDSLGHGEGDRLLKAVAKRLTLALRPEDTIARFGGDEFAILLEDQPGEARAREVAERVLATLSAPFTFAEHELFVRCSIGLAMAEPGQDAEGLLRQADMSMYAAKDRGKGRIEVFESSMAAAADTRLALKGDLERALERGEYDLLYQPITDLRNGRIAGVECLIRWNHPTRGRISPTEFIPLAEETGLIVAIGNWCLEQSCAQIAAWDAAVPDGPRISMSVNVSGRQIARGRVFVDEVADILARSGVAPQRLSLEVTESMLMADTEATVATIGALKALGVKLSLDDFGTGYSSLSYLRRFPFDTLKIDRSFVMAMSAGSDQLALTRSILKLAETMRLGTVAEGIEDAYQLATLRELGADYGQGYLFARPMTVAAVTELLAAGGGLEPSDKAD